MTAQSQKGFLGGLFDFSFSTFVTVRVVRVLYGLGLVVAAIGAVVAVVAGFADSAVQGGLMMVLAPLALGAAILYLRIVLEIMVVVFRIAENVERLADRP